jgi:hypothetical protein
VDLVDKHVDRLAGPSQQAFLDEAEELLEKSRRGSEKGVVGRKIHDRTRCHSSFEQASHDLVNENGLADASRPKDHRSSVGREPRDDRRSEPAGHGVAHRRRHAPTDPPWVLCLEDREIHEAISSLIL